MPILRRRMKPSSMSAIAVLVVFGVLVVFIFANIKFNNIQAAEAHFQNALIHHQNDKLANANLELDEAIRLAPDNAYYYSCQGLINARIAEKEGGGRLLSKFLDGTANPSKASIKYIDDSILFYHTALLINPHDGLNHHNLGWLFWLKGDKQKAIASIKRAIASAEKNHVYYVSLGLMEDKSGNSDAAIQAYQEALMLYPRLLDSRLYADLARKDSAKAASILQKAIASLEKEARLRPNPIIRARLGRLYLQNKNAATPTVLGESLSQLPNMSIAWFNLGQWHESKKDWDQTIKCFEKAAFLESSEPSVFVKLGKTHESFGKFKEATIQYEKAIAAEVLGHSEHSRIVLGLYHSKSAEANDLIPKGLLAYCRPVTDISVICKKLATNFAQAGNIQRSRYYEALWKRMLLDEELPSNK
jgi:tetratricopeptide (TPR) repeat protein